jgi:hypothetical protein
MALSNQIHLYSVDTSSFYTDAEMMFHRYLSKQYKSRTDIMNLIKKASKAKNEKLVCRLNKALCNINKRIKYVKDYLYKQFSNNKYIRTLRESAMNKYNIISMFDSSLTRIMNIPVNSITEDLIIVQTYFFEIIEDIIKHGFMYKGEKYVCFTASAGQIRTKKTVFIKESMLIKYINTITCGLTIDKINSKGGVNINKYLAYLALCNSATDEWKDFDITKTIVVDDMETMVKGEVDFIDDITYEIERKIMDIPISHTDGAGMILSSKSKKNKMFRAPWIKGLLISVPFSKFIREKSKETGKYCGIVKDIYGVEHDILKEKIEVILTKSQFKMYKYYSSWKEYQDLFVKYKCEAGTCNEEEDIFNEAKLNYQMLQTLTDMTDEELEKVCNRSINNIKNIGSDRKTMLKVLGVVKSNINKNYIQQALDIYPELLNDTYSKEILKQVKKSLVKASKAGKIDINGIYTFICPDMYAFCEYLFLGDENPKGLIKSNEVYCALYPKSKKLDCLRSPHLYKEHAVRNNVIDDEKAKWFVTDGLYTSCHDLISKMLQFDVDGDKALVCSDETIIQAAERNMRGIVPLYYNMKKAAAEIISNESIYNGLKSAYTGGNIGLYSNNISKIYNSDNINLTAVKLLCMENNFTIDFAKTLYKPERPKDKEKIITSYTKSKVPHFFIYAKDKDKNQVEDINDSTVNKLNKIIPNPNINFNALNLGEFDYMMLMKNKNVELDTEIIRTYTKLDLKKHFMINSHDEESSNIVYLYEEIKNKILEVNNDVNYVVDVLVKYLYEVKQSSFKTTLWECFGDVIVENIKENINSDYTPCERCGKRLKIKNNQSKYCTKCAKDVKKEQNRIADKKYKEKKRSEKLKKTL